MENVTEEKAMVRQPSRRRQKKYKKEQIKAQKTLMEQLNPMTRKQKFRRLMRTIWEHRIFYLMLLPSFVLLCIFAYQPMYGIIIAFKTYSPRLGIFGSRWVGTANFELLFSGALGETFWNAFKNTVVLNLLKLIFGFPASIILAIQINACRNKFFKNAIQTIVYLPHFVSWVVVAGLIFALLNERTGSLYRILTSMGVNLNVFGDGKQFLVLLIISDIWKEVGWGAIIYLAALSGISADYYEAAEIDGANSIQQFFHITLPQLMPTISIMLILRVGGLIGGGFDQVYNLYNTQVYDVADILDTFVYRYGIGEGQFELGTAVGLLSNVINIALLLFANQVVAFINKEK